MVVTSDALAWMCQSAAVPLGSARGILGRGGVCVVLRGVGTLTSRPSGKIEYIHEQAWKVSFIAFTGVHGFNGAEWVCPSFKGSSAFSFLTVCFQRSPSFSIWSCGLFSAHGMNIHDSHVVISMIPSVHGSFGLIELHCRFAAQWAAHNLINTNI
jgi:hypothetical protein